MTATRTPIKRIVDETRWFPGSIAALAAIIAVYVIVVEGIGVSRLPVLGVTALVIAVLALFVRSRKAVPLGGRLDLVLALGSTGVLYVVAVAPVNTFFFRELSASSALVGWIVAAVVIVMPLILVAVRFARR